MPYRAESEVVKMSELLNACDNCENDGCRTVLEDHGEVRVCVSPGRVTLGVFIPDECLRPVPHHFHFVPGEAQILGSELLEGAKTADLMQGR